MRSSALIISEIQRRAKFSISCKNPALLRQYLGCDQGPAVLSSTALPQRAQGILATPPLPSAAMLKVTTRFSKTILFALLFHPTLIS